MDISRGLMLSLFIVLESLIAHISFVVFEITGLMLPSVSPL